MNRTRSLFLSALSITSGGILSSCGTTSSVASPSSACGSQPTVTAHGSGTASGTPDIARISLAVQTNDSSASSALNSNSALAHKLINSLMQNGINKSDVQTTGLSLNAIYGGPSASITGYQVTNTVNAKITNISSLGKIIDDASSAAGNSIRVNNVTFSAKDSSALYALARTKAVAQAQVEAKSMAKASGKSLGRLCSINDIRSSSSPKTISSFGTANSSASSTPIEPGSDTVSATVSAVYQLG